jgi:hypothetical protein
MRRNVPSCALPLRRKPRCQVRSCYEAGESRRHPELRSLLLRALFAIGLMCALLEPAVRSAAAGAVAALHARAAIAAGDETELAVARARHALARWVAEGNDSGVALPPNAHVDARCTVLNGDNCAIRSEATITWSAPGSPRATPCPNDACAAYDQANDDVSEGRVEAALVITAVGTGGVVLATRTTRVRFRTWRVAPYAALDGRGDGTFSPDFEDAGDDGGATDGTGTLATTVYRNAVTGATIPANVWRRRLAPAATAPLRWSP